MSDLKNRVEIEVAANATQANKVLADLPKKGKEAGERFGKNFNQAQDRWLRVAEGSFRQYGGRIGGIIGEIIGEFDKISKAMESTGKKSGILGGILGGIGITALISGVGIAIEKWQEYNKRIEDVQKSLGLTKKETNDFIKIWGGLTSAEKMVKPFEVLYDKMEKARQGAKNLQKELAKLGLNEWMTKGEVNAETAKQILNEPSQAKRDVMLQRNGMDVTTFDAQLSRGKSNYPQSIGADDLALGLNQVDPDTQVSPEQRTVIAQRTIAEEAAVERLKEATEAANQSKLKDGEKVRALMVEIDSIKQQIAKTNDIIKISDLKIQLLKKEAELQTIKNKLDSDLNDAKEKELEEKRAAHEARRKAVEDEAAKISAEDPKNYDPNKLSPVATLQKKQDEILEATMSPAELALKRSGYTNDPNRGWVEPVYNRPPPPPSKRGGTFIPGNPYDAALFAYKGGGTAPLPGSENLGSSATKERLDLAKRMGKVGSYKRGLSSAALFPAREAAQTNANKLQQLLDDYISNGNAVAVKPKNGK